MIDRAYLENTVTGIFRDALNLVPPSPDTDLFAEGALDSLLLVDLLFKLEQHFSIRIPLEQIELDHFRSVASIAGFLAVCLREQRVA
jgi:acyl carrier protein